MAFPGEQLISKMWESLIDKGIGSLLRPRSIRADGRANTQVKAEEILLLAQAERQALAIRKGELDVVAEAGKPLLLITTEKQNSVAIEEPTKQLEKQKPQNIQRNPTQVALNSIASDQIRKEVNISKAILFAESLLEEDTTKVTDQPLNDDWLFRWQDYAGQVVTEDIQQLWGKLLAGEIKQPGKFSLRTLDFIKNISTKEARNIEEIAPLILTDFIFRDEKILERRGISFGFLLRMQEIGILSGVESIGVQRILPSFEVNRFIHVLTSDKRAIVIKHTDSTRKCQLPIYALTELGQEVLTLCNTRVNEGYIQDVARSISNLDFQVETADCILNDGLVQWFNSKIIKKEQP
jgi:hypothetical protein